MSAALDWRKDGLRWPHRDASEFVSAGGLDWHVQRMGSGPELVLLHGTGASCHSWAGAIPLLAEHFTITVPDLPGHAFTSGRPRGGITLASVTQSLGALLGALGVRPALIAGHSAGAAIAIEYARQNNPAVPLVGVAPAIMPFPGLAARLFPAMAKALFVNPFVPRMFAATMHIPGETERFLKRATGSPVTSESLHCYERLLGNHKHCEGALAMMADWDLDSFSEQLSTVPNPSLLIHGRSDKSVPTASVAAAAARMPNAELKLLADLGHLAHEQAPDQIAALILEFAAGHTPVRAQSA